jgi:pyruvate dehydrogenase E1 component alpha subunit
LEEWLKKDPIPMYRQRLLDFGIEEKVVTGIEMAVIQAVDEATEAAKASPTPPLEYATTDVWADGGSSWRN